MKIKINKLTNKTFDLLKLQNDLEYNDNEIYDWIKAKNNRNYVLSIDEKLVGFVMFQVLDDIADLLYINIHPKYRGNGYSKILFIECLKKINVKEIFLEVSINNIKAIKLYEKLNFVKISKRKKYYKNNSDAIIYKLQKGEKDE